MTVLVLTRHGETVWHAENRYAGSSDVALTDRGHTQATQLAAWARGGELDAVWCSPLQRAVHTVRAAAQTIGVDPVIDTQLREIDFGDAEGFTTAEMARRFPADYQAFLDDPVEHHLPGGESPKTVTENVLDALSRIASHHPQGRVLVVTHSTAMRLGLCALLRHLVAALSDGVPVHRQLRTDRRSGPMVPTGRCCVSTCRCLWRASDTALVSHIHGWRHHAHPVQRRRVYHPRAVR